MKVIKRIGHGLAVIVQGFLIILAALVMVFLPDDEDEERKNGRH